MHCDQRESLLLRPAAAPSSLAAADESDFGALGAGSVDEVDGVDDLKGRSKGSNAMNPWNRFQNAHRGMGLTSTVLSRMYQGRKSKET